jgi:hypothetical protein
MLRDPAHSMDGAVRHQEWQRDVIGCALFLYLGEERHVARTSVEPPADLLPLLEHDGERA